MEAECDIASKLRSKDEFLATPMQFHATSRSRLASISLVSKLPRLFSLTEQYQSDNITLSLGGD